MPRKSVAPHEPATTPNGRSKLARQALNAAAGTIRKLIIVLGDQLDINSPALQQVDPQLDHIWMSETPEEVEHVWCHKLRIAFFFSCMRHFRDNLINRGLCVEYRELPANAADDQGYSFTDLLRIDLARLRPQEIIVVEPGDYRVEQRLLAAATEAGIPLTVLPDTHFYATKSEFATFAHGKKQIVMETFYRSMRKKHGVLMDSEDQPVGGAWNFDEDNRESFTKDGPATTARPLTFPPDATTKSVLKLVETRFPNNPGRLDHFNLPVTSADARRMLDHFIQHTLPLFGQFEDAMWTDEPFLYHSRLSTSLNMHLLNPRECVAAAEAAYAAGRVPLNSAEGFIRQILGWREFVRGIYWLKMPGYIEKNFFGHSLPLPEFFWTGETEMQCVKQSMQHVLNEGYAHHIHRLMVLGNLALTYGAHPRHFHDWHMAMYLDAIDWASLPNTLGMSQFGDGGIVGTKPYCSTGNYIDRMSNFCKGCQYNIKLATGPTACPVTTFYWDFLIRNRETLRPNHRMAMQLKNVDRKSEADKLAIADYANELRQQWQPQPG